MFIEERLATSANTRLVLAQASEAEGADIFGAITEELHTYTEAAGVIRVRNDVLCIVGWWASASMLIAVVVPVLHSTVLRPRAREPVEAHAP